MLSWALRPPSLVSAQVYRPSVLITSARRACCCSVVRAHVMGGGAQHA